MDILAILAQTMVTETTTTEFGFRSMGELIIAFEGFLIIVLLLLSFIQLRKIADK